MYLPLQSLPSFLYYHPLPRILHSFPTRRSSDLEAASCQRLRAFSDQPPNTRRTRWAWVAPRNPTCPAPCRRPLMTRSEEHTSELQSRGHLVCGLLLEKKNKLNNVRL